MNVHFECDDVVYSDVHKYIKKIVRWCEKNLDKYFSIVDSVNNCILVTSSARVSTPTWFSFSAINADGDLSDLDIHITDEQIKKQLYKLVGKAKDFTCTIETNTNQPTGFHPILKFERDEYLYILVLYRMEISIYVSRK